MKKITVRVEDNIYDRLFLIAKENSTSANKIINRMIENNINDPEGIKHLEEMESILLSINNYLDKISKRQYQHFKLSQQHFANFGYLSNADIREDKCLKEVLNTMDSFYE